MADILQGLARTKNILLDGKYSTNLTMSTTTSADSNHFIHRLTAPNGVQIGDMLNVPKRISLKPEISLGTTTITAADFFGQLGCLDTTRSYILMDNVNQIKQALDTVKDGTAIALLKKLKIWDFGQTWQYIRYPDTLNLLKEYFFKHFEREGRCNNVFWPRHGDYTGYVLPDELASHDCGFDPELVHIKGMTDKLDPLSHGTIKNTDVIFPTGDKTITWDSSTLESLGYPRGCEITAKCNSAAVSQHSNWDISVTCANSSRDRIILMNSSGIFKLNPNGGVPVYRLQTKIINTLEDTIKGNAFKGLTQKGEKDTPNNQLIFMGLVFNKSFGDNGFDMEQRALAMLGVPTTIYTCDFTLFLSSITAMTESGAVLTTNHREEPGLPTGNLSTRFRATELQPSQELRSIFDSCSFENNAYLQMLKNMYNDALARRPPSIQIKLGGARHEVNLWFLVTIIDTIEVMIRNHQQIIALFTGLQMVTTDPIDPEWRTHKQYILQLLKSYCKIVFPFVIKNGEWNVFCQSSLISKFPAPRPGKHAQISTLIQSCQALNLANKDALTNKMNEVLRRNEKPISVVKLNMQQYALIVKNKFTIADNARLNSYQIPAPAQGGGGRNKRRDNIKIGGMFPTRPDNSPPPTGYKRADYSPPHQSSAVPLAPPVAHQKKSKQHLPPQEEKDKELNTSAKILFEIDAFVVYIQSLSQSQIPASSPRSPKSNSEMGFSPRAFCEDEPGNRIIFLLIKFSDVLSHILKLVSYIITSGINDTDAAAGGGAAAPEPEAEPEIDLQYSKCKTAMQDFQSIYGGENQHPLWGLAAFLDSRPEILKQTHNSDVLVHLYSNIKEGYDLVIQKLKDSGINPSSDTIEFAITSFNGTIRVQLQNPARDFVNRYNQHQRRLLQLIPGADEAVMNSLSLDVESLYENIKNIAYNLFLNHEYELPLICSEYLFTKCLEELIGESVINITLEAGDSLGTVAQGARPEVVVGPGPTAPVLNPRDNQSLVGVPNVWESSLSPDSIMGRSDGVSAGESFPDVDSDSLPGIVSPTRGASSARSRRKLRRNHRRTQYTNRHKRSAKSTKHATIKHRKSYRKHNRTIKRRKNSRRRNQ